MCARNDHPSQMSKGRKKVLYGYHCIVLYLCDLQVDSWSTPLKHAQSWLPHGSAEPSSCWQSLGEASPLSLQHGLQLARVPDAL